MSEDLKDRALGYIKDYKTDMETLQVQRESALKQYMREPYGDEEEGRSRVITSDIFDTVETVMPYLMRIFYGGQDVAKFSGHGENDEEGAKLLGELVNFFFQRRMGGFILLHDWMKEALIHRISIAKYWYEKRTEYKEKAYADISESELDYIVSQPGTVVEDIQETIVQEATLDDFGMEIAPAVKNYNVKVKIEKLISQPKAEAIPSEDVLFDVRAKCISDSPVIHKCKKHISEMIQKYNLKEEDIKDTAERFETDPVYQQRFEDLGGVSFFREEDTDYYYTYECYLDEYDAKGNKKAMKIVIFGDEELEREENTYGEPPFCELSPIRLPHRAVGLSYPQILEDLQKIHTALMRAILDNIYFQNNAREAFDPSVVDADALIDGNRPGGKIPIKKSGVDIRTALMPLTVTPLAPQTYQMLKTVAEDKQDRSGINRYVQGDDKGLNKTAFGVNTLLNQAMQRQELLARIFAETGISKLFRKLAEMTIEFMDQPTAIKLNGQWQTINPRDIDVEFDVNIDVGQGTGTKDVVVQQMQMMLQMSIPLIQMGIVTRDNIYNIMKNIYEAMGYKNVEQYITEVKEAEGINALLQGPAGAAFAAGAGTGAAPMESQGINGQPFSPGVPGIPTPAGY